MLWLFCVYCRASLLEQISPVAAKKSRVARDFFSGPWWIKEHRSSYTQPSVPGMMMIPRCQWQPRFATNGEDWCGGTARLSCHNHDNLKQCWCFFPISCTLFSSLALFSQWLLKFLRLQDLRGVRVFRSFAAKCEPGRSKKVFRLQVWGEY